MTPEPISDVVQSSKQGGFKGYKKKGSIGNGTSHRGNKLFKGLGFRIGKDGPKLYEKTIDKLALYTSMQFKSGSVALVCLHAEEYVATSEVPIMPEDPTDNDQRVWEYMMGDYLKSEKLLKRNLRNLYTVVMSLCDTEVKKQVKASVEYKVFNKKLDSMMLLKYIKKIVYTGGSDNLHTKHNTAMAHLNFMNLRQEKYQDIQDFRDQYLSIKKVCTELGLRFGRCEDDAKATLTTEGITEPTKEQLKRH